MFAVGVLAAACTPDARQASPAGGESGAQRAGGTLRVGVVPEPVAGPPCTFLFCGGNENDPQIAGIGTMGFEIERCCLVRTLLGYNGRPTSEGGGTLRPDVAAELPRISADGLTWTFRLRRGLRYAPPLEDTEITAFDFIRSIERAMRPLPPSLPDYFGEHLDSYTVDFLNLVGLIAGADEYANGGAESISGLTAPNPHTLEIHLTRPAGNIGYIVSQPDLAPIPPNPHAPDARFGVAQGHERFYFSYLVASGPYMIEGAEDIDFSVPPSRQLPASGDAPDSLTLVRNPSWDPSADPLRPAHPDRIVLTPVPDEGDARRLVRTRTLDLVFNWEAPPRLLEDPRGAGRTFTTLRDWVVFVHLNLAVPPLDDIHVRRAMNLAVARAPLLRHWERAGLGASVATHLGLDSEENNLLLNFDPYDAASADESAARKEMARSRYDRDGDGVCDAAPCRDLVMIARTDFPEQVTVARAVAEQLRTIGLEVQVDAQGPERFGSTYGTPEARIALRLDQWIKDLPSGATYFPPLFGTPGTGVTSGNNQSMLGASPRQLRRWGYEVTSVPSVDDRIESCLGLTFGLQTRCWADLDAYLMTEIVPWIPLVTLDTGRLTSSRVHSLSFDQAAPTPMPSLDRVVLRPEVAPRPSPAPSHPVPSIPNGVYGFTITPDDLARFAPDLEPPAIAELTGTTKVIVQDGAFAFITTADHPIEDPVAVGSYHGSGSSVRFEIEWPSYNALSTPPMRWSFDGRALHLRFLGCGNLNRLDPRAPHLCEEFRSTFEAHPWVKIG